MEATDGWIRVTVERWCLLKGAPVLIWIEMREWEEGGCRLVIACTGRFHQRVQELDFTAASFHLSQTDLTKKKWRLTLWRSRHPRTCLLSFSHLHSSASQFTSFASALALAASRAAFRAGWGFPLLRESLASQAGLNYRASHQFVSTGEPAANWKTCTLATLHNEQCWKTLKRKCQVCPVVSADIKGSSTILKQSKCVIYSQM